MSRYQGKGKNSRSATGPSFPPPGASNLRSIPLCLSGSEMTSSRIEPHSVQTFTHDSSANTMAESDGLLHKAQRRVDAIGSQLGGPHGTSSPRLPPIHKVAGPSSGLRACGKVVIITGANSALGIGRATAHQFAENGAKAIYICDYDDSNLAAHQHEMKAAYPHVDVHPWQFDAADEDKVKAVVDDALERYGQLDVFFANAGITGMNTVFTEFTGADFMEVMRTNTLSVFLAAKYAAPAMMKTSPSKPQSCGSIIGTASVAGLRSNAGSTPYSASKTAVVSLAQTMAYQLAGTNVRVNAICPGLIETGMTALVYESARARGSENKIGQLNPTKRGGHADEIARVALFLGSDESSYVNGQAWAVCGGLSAGHPFVPGRIG
ncbi:hypothetical protein E4U19_006897 [Claviceps sp. Clav32 group G5]|nr:hypothetical protein E4U40_005190 [Claviceps sp. LM458 group G5]KAG6033123.1 hypothetical protein E4U19_006897 [Claviceps sp. Clav32 group G5]